MRVIKANLCLPPQPLCYWIEQDGLHFEMIDEELEVGVLETTTTTTTLTEQARAKSVEMFNDEGEVPNSRWEGLMMEWGFNIRLLQKLKKIMPVTVREAGRNTFYSIPNEGGGGSSNQVLA